MAIILDGKKIQQEALANLAKEVSTLTIKPILAIVQVGNRSDSSAFIAAKKKLAEQVGISVQHIHLAETVEEKEVLKKINECNLDTKISGIIVQLPLPAHLSRHNIINAIHPSKDVDGLGMDATYDLWEGRGQRCMPATVKGILTLFNTYKISLEGKNIVIVGRSSLVGRPLAIALLNANATVTIAHAKTKNLADITKAADIICVAVGKPGLIGKDHVCAGQIIIDIGITKDGELTKGDVDFEAVSPIVEMITPVPGGIGPLTVLSLLENTIQAAKQ